MPSNYFKSKRPYRKFMVFLKKVRIANGQASLYDVGEVLLSELKADPITVRSSYMAFNFTLAIFPSIIFLFTLIPYISKIFSVEDLDVSIMDFLHDFMPNEMYFFMESTIEDIINKPRGGLLSFGFVFALVLSTNGLMSLMDAFDKKYHTFRQRSYLKKRLMATILTVGLAFIIFVAIAAIFFGTYILDILVFYEFVTAGFTYGLIVFLKYIAVGSLFFLANSLIYYYVPAVQDKWPFFSAGAVVSTMLIFLVSYLFSLYISNFDTYNKLYGSIGALIGLMIWLDFVCMILILGFEINISVDSVTKRLENRV